MEKVTRELIASQVWLANVIRVSLAKVIDTLVSTRHETEKYEDMLTPHDDEEGKREPATLEQIWHLIEGGGRIAEDLTRERAADSIRHMEES